MAGWDYEQISNPLNDTRVDNISMQSGVIDRLPALNADLDDAKTIRNLNARIDDSLMYWNQPEGFNLNEARNENVRLHLGRQIDVTHMYRFQVPYVENEIFVATETIVSYLTSQQPQPEVYPAQDTPQSKKMAIDLEKVLMAHSAKFELSRKLEAAIRNLLLKRIGIIKLEFDPSHGKNGEVIPKVINPEHVIIDKNVPMDGNPEFICHILKYSAGELISKYPDKKQEIMECLGITDEGSTMMTQEVAVREVWFTNDEDNEEYCVTYFANVVLGKYKNPNWLYHGDNFLDMPKKPFIPLNYINDGTHWIDVTTPVEQASNMQNVLNKRGRQIMENADKANGILVISTDSGLTKDDAQNLTGEPNQKLVIKTAGQPINSLVYQVPPHDLPSYVLTDKLDQRQTIHNIMGTPSEFTGSEDSSSEKTLGQAMMAKNQAASRQDLIVRAIDSFMHKYFNFLTQMMLVWYNKDHFFVYNGGDGGFDYITMRRNLIEQGMVVNVKSGATLPFDKSRQEAIALQLAKMGMIDPYNLYKDLHMDSPQKRYDAWYKWKIDPKSLARDAMDEIDDMEAYVDFTQILAGKDVAPRDDASKEHVLTHRKQMISDKFLKASVADQKRMLKHVKGELESLELRTSLDIMSSQDIQSLDPSVPIPPVPPMQPPQVPQQPQMQGPQAGPTTNGTPMMDPSNPTMPNPGGLAPMPPV